MDPERWRQIEHLFHQASLLPPDDRAAFVHDTCCSDPSLLTELEALLAADAEPNNEIHRFVRREILNFLGF